MKKIILAAALFVSTFAQAQISVWDGETQLENDGVYDYTTLGESAKMHLLVQNDTDQTINVKLQMVDIVNNQEGIDVQFCRGLCYTVIYEGLATPSGAPSEFTTITPGSNDGGIGYFFNAWEGDNTAEPVSYKMALVYIDAAGNPTGEPIITFTYKYDPTPTASTTDFASLEQMGIIVNNTVVNSTLDITANQNAKLQIVNINGQTVKKTAIVNGSQAVDLSAVAAGVYFARFTTQENKTAQIKIVKN